MTRKQWDKLTDEGKRETVMQAWGWTDILHCYTGLAYQYSRGTSPEGLPNTGCNDVLNSLDAMHEAVRSIEDGVIMGKYQANLQTVVAKEDDLHPLCIEMDMRRTEATAMQRAEAFALTISNDN